MEIEGPDASERSCSNSSDSDLLCGGSEASDLHADSSGETLEDTLDEVNDEADEQYTWRQKLTVVEFTHTRFRDIVRIEGHPRTDEGGKQHHDPLPILNNIHRVHIVMVIECLKSMHLGSSKGIPCNSF